jgi:conserved oligomeric Golgi complex subunit 4
LGAIRFDRDLRAITAYLSSQLALGDARDKFARLHQVSTVLNLDSVGSLLLGECHVLIFFISCGQEEDVDEFYNGSGITWKLSAQEARMVAALKV